MKKLVLVALLAVSMSASAGVAFLKSNYVSGTNRICIYDHMGSKVINTISSFRICPLSINV